MNETVEWRRRVRIAIVLSAIVGAVIGTVSGYVCLALYSGPERAPAMLRWFSSSPLEAGIWPAVGAACGALQAYAKALLK